MLKLTQERLKQVLSYNSQSGVFTRRENVSKFVKGSVAGHETKSGHIRIGIDSCCYPAGRLAVFYMKGFIPEELDVRHKNKDHRDNSWDNLRITGRLCNIRNKAVAKNNTSGIPGVKWQKKGKKWRAVIGVNKKHIHLAFSGDKDFVVRARWEAEIEYNFLKCNKVSPAYLYLKERGLI